MKKQNDTCTKLLFSAVLLCLCGGAAALAQPNAPFLPPAAGSGIEAILQADQDIYTNQPAQVWCPPCTTNDPPCMLPCYYYEAQTAVAHFTFTVRNNYNRSREFQFATSQQFDVELVDQNGDVVAAWSDDKFFFQTITSFSLDPGESVAFTADVPLKDRSGLQLNGIYQARAFLTTSDPQPRVSASTVIGVMVAQ